VLERGFNYGKNVISGEIPACAWVRLAAQRHFDDLKKWNKKSSPYYFDEMAAKKIVSFYRLVKHSKGAMAGQSFELSDWQVFWVSVMFGWKRQNGLRRFQTVYFGVPRKNGKTTFAVPIGLYMMILDSEAGAEIYSAATKRDQARLVFDEAQRMVNSSPELKQVIKVQKHSLFVESTATKFEALSSDAKSLDGLNPHCVLIDELHAHKTPDLYGVLETAIGARLQPLILSITTAGFVTIGICVDQRDYGRKVVQGLIEDDSFMFVDYGIDEGDDPFSEDTWKKANPNYGVSIEPETFRRTAKKAQNEVSFLNEFLTKHLNVWTTSVEAYFDMNKWNDCALDFDWEHFKKCTNIHLGLDLSETQDLCALVLVGNLDGTTLIFPKFYLPKDNIVSKSKKDGANYVAWEKAGYLTLLDGDVIDYDYIYEDILQIDKDLDLEELVFDKWNARQLINNLDKQTYITCVEFPQMMKFFSPILKEFVVMMHRKEIAHNNNKILNWNISNTTVITDPSGNVRPNKEKGANKIDGTVATLMALSRYNAKMQSELQAADDGTFL
jgi:phage terminase large subunit-like protein